MSIPFLLTVLIEPPTYFFFSITAIFYPFLFKRSAIVLPARPEPTIKKSYIITPHIPFVFIINKFFMLLYYKRVYWNVKN